MLWYLSYLKYECGTAFKMTTMPGTNYKRAHTYNHRCCCRRRSLFLVCSVHLMRNNGENQYFLTDAFQMLTGKISEFSFSQKWNEDEHRRTTPNMKRNMNVKGTKKESNLFPRATKKKKKAKRMIFISGPKMEATSHKTKWKHITSMALYPHFHSLICRNLSQMPLFFGRFFDRKPDAYIHPYTSFWFNHICTL